MFLLIDGMFMATLRVLVAVMPILLGAVGIFHALAFARRSGRRGWWVLVVFSCLLLIFATVSIVNPWSGDVGGAIKVVGGTLMYSALVFALSLVWIWPFDRGEE